MTGTSVLGLNYDEDRTHIVASRVHRGTGSLPQIRRRRKADSFDPALNACAARARLQKEVSRKPKSARTKAEGQALGLGPRFPRSGLYSRLRFCFINLPGELCIGQSFATDRTNQSGEPLRVVHVTVIESATLFSDIPEQVKGFHTDVGPVQGALQETPEVLHTIGMDVPIRVLDSVIDYRVLIVSLKPFVGFQFIAKNSRTGFDLFVDVLLKFFLPAIVNHEGPHFPATLDHAHNDSLVLAAGPGDALFTFRLMHVTRFAADEGFVYFNFPAQLTAALFALLSKADTMKQEPCGLLSNAERPRYLATTDTVLGILKHPHCRKPLVQADGGIFHDGSNLDGELAPRIPNAALPAKLVST